MELQRFVIMAFAAFLIVRVSVIFADRTTHVYTPMWLVISIELFVSAALVLYVMWPLNERTWIYCIGLAGATELSRLVADQWSD